MIFKTRTRLNAATDVDGIGMNPAHRLGDVFDAQTARQNEFPGVDPFEPISGKRRA